MSIDTQELRKAILYNLLLNEDYSRKVVPFLKEEYFTEAPEKVIFEEIRDYFNEYSTPPRNAAIRIEVEERDDLTQPIYEECVKFLSHEPEPIKKIDFLVAKTEEWCQERAIVNAVFQAVNIIGGEDKKTPMTALPTMLQEAISTSFDKSVGHDFIEDAEDRWEFYNRKEEKVPTQLEHFDYILRGGIPSKTLGVIMAGTGVGKSLFMCSTAANLVESGHNVLYITMEMAEEKIAQRIDQNLLNLSSEDLDTIGKDSFLKRFQNLKVKTQGKLVVKEYPTSSAGAAHFRALIKELEMKKNFVPDLICVDYLNICSSMSAPKGANSYEKIKCIAEELRALAMEFDVPVLTATQTNRDGMHDTDVDITSVSESFGLPMTADYFFAMTTSDQLREDGMIRFSQLKNRYGDPADRRNWLLGVDYSRMRVFDLEDQPAHIDALNNAEASPKKPTTLDDKFEGGRSIMDINWS